MEGEERLTALILMSIVFLAAVIVLIVFAIAAKNGDSNSGIEVFGSYIKSIIGMIK